MANALTFDSLIFDLDGTLWDANATYLRAWNEVLATSSDTGTLTLNDLQSVMGFEQKKAWNTLFPNLSEAVWKLLAVKIDRLQCDYSATMGGYIYPGVNEFLPELAQKYRLYIVSNCPKGLIDAFYAYSKLGDLFSDFEEHGRTHLPKAQNIKLVIKRNELRKPVYIGDTNSDKQSAEIAGVPFKWVSYGFGQAVDEQAFNDFKSLSEYFL